jgi:hypothetical protein
MPKPTQSEPHNGWRRVATYASHPFSVAQCWTLPAWSLLTTLLLFCGIMLAQSTTVTQQPFPPVYFNHANLLLSPALYDAINRSELLNKQFCDLMEKTVSGEEGHIYTNIYVHGKDTYLELKNSAPLNQKQLRRNMILFEMSIDDRTQLPAISENFEREHIHAPVQTETRVLNGRAVKWFDGTDDAVWEDNPDPAHTPWFQVVAMYPGYLKEAYPDLKHEEDGTTREKYNARKYRSDLLMRDVTGFDIDITQDQLPILTAQFRAMGYKLENKDNVTRAIGPEVTFTLRIVKPATPLAIDIHFSLNKMKEGQQVYVFPDSQLTFHSDKTATWTFPSSLRR